MSLRHPALQVPPMGGPVVLAGFVLLAVTRAKSRRGGILLDQEEVRHYLDELIVFFIR